MPLWLRLAVRELRGGLTGLRLLAVCLFLGVAAIAGVGSLSSSIISAIDEQGQTLLGADVEVRFSSREATPQQRTAIAGYGIVSEGVRMRSMVRPTGANPNAPILAELKAVDGNYPLYGRAALAGGAALQPALAGDSVVVAQAIADQLALKVGDRVEIGAAQLRVAGILTEEPDRAGQGFSLGPTAMVSLQTLTKTGVDAAGSLYTRSYRIKLPAGANAAAVEPALEARFPDAGWDIRDRSNGAPGVQRFVERLGQFLTLVGLTALVVAGVGVGNGVASYLDTKSTGIASLKSLGATSGLIFRSYLAQIGLVALAAVVVGAIVGTLLPWLVVQVVGDQLPVPPRLGIYPVPLLTAGAFGLLIALAFALPPLDRARTLPAARLFRDRVEGAPRPAWPILLACLAAGGAIVALAVMQAREPLFAAAFVGAALALVVVLTLLAVAIRWAARRAPRPSTTLGRLALANLHRPGAPTRQLIVALGLGLTLFATLAVIETNLRAQIEKTIPRQAPTFFVLDLPKEDAPRFEAAVRDAAPAAKLRLVPNLRGPVTALNGTPVTELKDIPEGAWFLRGDRGLTYSAAVPEGNRVVEGEWWPKDYAGPPLVSLDVEGARAAGLKVGDTITVSVLGVEVTATLANTRRIDWDSLGINFAMVFSPSALEGAPHGWLATVEVPPAEERAAYLAMTRNFPTASVIRVKEVVGTVSGVLEQIAAAIRAAASVTVAAGIAVLVGALAAARRARIYDAVILKVLGATRGQVLRALVLEYGLLAFVVSGLAFALGAGAGWVVVVKVFEFDWQPYWLPVLATVAIGAVVTLGLALAGSWTALSAKPNRVLRSL